MNECYPRILIHITTLPSYILSIFISSEKQLLENNLRNIENWDLVTLILVAIFIILAITRYLFPRKFHEFTLLPITDKYFMLQQKGYEVKHLFSLLLLGVQVLSFSLFIYLFLHVTKEFLIERNPWLFLQIGTGLFVFLGVKYLSEKIIAHIFNIEGIINRYLHEKLSYTNLISLLVLMGNIVFFFAVKPSKNILFIFSIVIATLYLIALLSSFKRNWSVIIRYSFYFILYLCALEIAPFIILYRLLV